MIYYVVPARAGSRGWPGKNIQLYKHTSSQLFALSPVIVSTDCPEIVEMATLNVFCVHNRARHAEDCSPIIGVMMDVAESYRMKADDIIVMLYLTYPGRRRKDIDNAILFFEREHAESMLCRFPAVTSPYMCTFEDGGPVIEHQLFRRQDYPRCYERSHYIAIMRVRELCNLGLNLYNHYTRYMDIEKPIDVDTEEDYRRFCLENGIVHTS